MSKCIINFQEGIWLMASFNLRTLHLQSISQGRQEGGVVGREFLGLSLRKPTKSRRELPLMDKVAIGLVALMLNSGTIALKHI